MASSQSPGALGLNAAATYMGVFDLGALDEGDGLVWPPPPPTPTPPPTPPV